MMVGTQVQELNTSVLADLFEKGASKKQIAQDFQITVADLNRKVAALKAGQGVLTQYRELQHLQLTDLQSKILEAITPDKIQCASLVELVSAFKVLKEKELVMTGKATSITGIVGYLVQLEKEETAAKEGKVIEVENAEDAVWSEVLPEVQSDLPNL